MKIKIKTIAAFLTCIGAIAAMIGAYISTYSSVKPNSEVNETNNMQVIINPQNSDVSKLLNNTLKFVDISRLEPLHQKEIAEGFKTLIEKLITIANGDNPSAISAKSILRRIENGENSEKLIEEIEQLIKNYNSDDATLLVQLHLALAALTFNNNPEKTLNVYTLVTRLAPSRPMGWHGLGYMQRRLGLMPAAINSFREVHDLAMKSGDLEWRALAHLNLGNIYRTLDEYDVALHQQNSAYLLFLELDDQRGIGVSLLNIGNIYRIRMELVIAEEKLGDARKILEEINYKPGLADVNGSLGILHKIKKEYKTSIKYYNDSLRINTELGRSKGMADAYGNLGILHRNLKEYETAINYYSESLKIEKTLGRQEGIAADYANLGVTYRFLREFDKAETHYLMAKKIETKLGRKLPLGNIYANLGLLKQCQSDSVKATEYLIKSKKIFESLEIWSTARLIQSWIIKVSEKKRSNIGIGDECIATD